MSMYVVYVDMQLPVYVFKRSGQAVSEHVCSLVL